MKSADIAALLVQGFQTQNNGNTDIGMHSGVVQTWDELTGLNSILINGNTFNNLSVLASSAITPFQTGDVVEIMRVQSQYFILGRVRAPGAGAAERIASARVASLQTVPNGGSMADLAGSAGPSVSLYVGSARRVLVIHNCEVFIGGVVDGGVGTSLQGVAVSGVSTMAAETAITNAYGSGTPGMGGSYTATTLVTATNGLNQGLNTFTAKYRATAGGAQSCQVNNRVLTVIPF